MPPTPSPPGSDVTPRPRHRRTLVIVGAIVAVFLVSGAAAAFVTLRGASERLLDHVPASTDAVAVAYLDPGAGQKVNLMRLAARFPSLGSSRQLHDNVHRALDSILQGAGLDRNDIGWVGPEVGVALDVQAPQAPTVSVLIATTDPSASVVTLKKLRDGSHAAWASETHEGVTVWTTADDGSVGPSAQAVVDGVVVLGNARSMVEGIIDASQGRIPSLQDDANFQATMADLPASKLGFVYLNAERVVDLLKEQPGFRSLSADPALQNLDAVQGIAASLSVQADGLALDTTEHYDRAKLSATRVAQLGAPAHPNPLFASVPQDAWGVASEEHIDTSLASLVDRARSTAPQVGRILDASGVSDLLHVLSGDLAVEGGRGSSSTLGGALLLGSTDDVAMQDALDRLASFVAHQAHVGWKQVVYRGVKITVLAGARPELPVAPAYGVVGHAAVVTTSIGEMHRIVDAHLGGANITASPAFVAARRDVPAGSSFFLDVQRLKTDVRAVLPPGAQAQFDREVAPDLDHVAYLVSGSTSSPESSRTRLFVRIT